MTHKQKAAERVVDADTVEALNALHALSREFRGSFLDMTIWVDLLLTDFLAEYFVPNDKEKAALLSSELISGQNVTFSRRIEILEMIIDRSFQDFKKSRPSFVAQLNKIRKFRNRLAHAYMDNSDDILNRKKPNELTLAFNEKGVLKRQVVTTSEFRKRLKECSDILDQLLELKMILVDGRSSSNMT